MCVAHSILGIMSFGDSKPVFLQRARDVGLEDAVIKAFTDMHLDTMARFAFSCSYSPGGADDSPFKELMKTVLKRDATLVEASCLRRLFNESYATVAADIRSQTEQTGESSTRKLAPADRAARLAAQQTRLTGLEIRGAYEPGDGLVDKCVSFYEQDRLQYLEWSQCVSREHELLTSSKKDQRLVVQASGELKVSQSSKSEPCDASSEIMLRYCLSRRGLALEQANVLSYSNHNKWMEKLLTSRLETAPPGFAKVTFQQLEAADKRLFILLAEKTRAGIKAQPDGRPCDKHFETCMSSTEVVSLLQPKPYAVGNSTTTEVRDPKRQKLEHEPGPKGKGKSKGGKSTFMRIPTELLALGCVGATSRGSRLCFSYNLKRCNGKVDKQRCDKGLHLCAVSGCLKQHPALDCPQKKQE